MADEEYRDVRIRRRDGTTVAAWLYHDPLSSGAYTGYVEDADEPIDARFDGITWHEVTERDELIRALTSRRGARAAVVTNRGVAADIVDLVADFLDSDHMSENRAAGLLREKPLPPPGLLGVPEAEALPPARYTALVESDRMTCPACPTQYDGILRDGRCFYFRYRSGRAELGVGRSVADAVADSERAPSLVLDPDSLDGELSRREYQEAFVKLWDLRHG